MSFSKSFPGDAMRRASRLAVCLLAVTALALSAACATHQAAPQKASADPEWWLSSLKIAQDRYTDAIVRSCPPQGFLVDKKCIRAKIVGSLARQGDAGTHCQAEDPLGGLMMCVELVTATEQTYRALGIDPRSVTDWDDPFDALAAVSQLVATRLTAKCPDAAQGNCIAQEVADIFAVPLSEADRCTLSTVVKRQVSCAIALIRIEDYKSALLAVPGAA